MSLDIALKVTALETMKFLIDACQNLSENSHYDSLVQCIVTLLQLHSGNKLIQMTSLSALQALLEKSAPQTLQALVSGVLSSL